MTGRLYDVFISSPKRDLEPAREAVALAMMSGPFRPVQMETFPASRRRADELIQSILLRSDYVVLILGLQYGSVIPETDLSFTELEYLRAREANIPVLAFLRALPEDSELEPRIAAFRARVEAEVTCQYWKDPAALARLAQQSLEWALDDDPRPGWVRADDLGVDPLTAIRDLAVPAAASGIARISLDGVAGATMGEKLRRSREIRLMSTTGQRLVETQKRALVDAVRAGADLRVLVPGGDTEFLADVAEIEGRDAVRDAIAKEIERLEMRLSEVKREAGGGRVRLGHMSTQLRSTLTLTDDWGWLTLTLPPLRTPETASFELIDGGERGLLAVAKQHFDKVWNVVSDRGKLYEIR